MVNEVATEQDIYSSSSSSSSSPQYQILSLCREKNEIAGKVHAIIDKFAERGLRALGVAFQVYYLSG